MQFVSLTHQEEMLWMCLAQRCETAHGHVGTGLAYRHELVHAFYASVEYFSLSDDVTRNL